MPRSSLLCPSITAQKCKFQPETGVFSLHPFVLLAKISPCNFYLLLELFMDIQELQKVIVDALEDVKAQDIQVFNTAKQTPLFELLVVATASSNRQTRALGHHVYCEMKEHGCEDVRIEGLETGEWVLVDCGDAVVHIMQPALRAYYNLEELWGAHPVPLKVLEEQKAKA
jgi:ribosome-associated protein